MERDEWRANGTRDSRWNGMNLHTCCLLEYVLGEPRDASAVNHVRGPHDAALSLVTDPRDGSNTPTSELSIL
jgi:hypothetical protein